MVMQSTASDKAQPCTLHVAPCVLQHLCQMRVVLDLQVFAREQKIDQVLLHCCNAYFNDLQQITVSNKHRATYAHVALEVCVP